MRNTHEELEERNQTNQAQEMCKRRHNRRELLPLLHHRAQEQRHKEQRQQNTRVPNDRTNGNNTDTNERTRVLSTILVGEGLDEHIRDDKDRRHANRPHNLREHDCSPTGTGNVTRKLLGRVSQFLLLVTGNHRPGQPTVPIPAARFMTRVSTRHPSQELPIVDDKVGERELMRVEQEWRDAERKHREPEVDEVRRPDGHGGIQQE